MKTMGRILTAVLVVHFTLYPQQGYTAPMRGAVKTEAPKKVAFSLVKQIVVDMKAKPETFFTKEELSLKARMIDKSVTNDVIADIKKKLSDNAYSFSEVKAQVLSQLAMEEQAKLIELKFALSKLDGEKLDRYFRTAMRDGLYGRDLQYAYDSAYGQREKLEVLMQMLHSDMSLIRSQNAKQIGLMSRADLLKQIETTNSIMSFKNDKTTQIIIIVLTIAAAGLLTWGIMSSTKARYEKKTKELHEDYDRREQSAIDANNQKIATLDQTFAERARLRDEGYTWQVCSTTRTPKTSACSYDFRSYSGEEVCVTNCLKSPAGAEVHHVKTCLSSFIPNNCFQRNETVAGTEDGYDAGYDRGYNVGYDRAYDAAYDSEYTRAYDSAYSPAYSSGYNSGYSSGFTSGYNDGYDANYVPPAPPEPPVDDCPGCGSKSLTNLRGVLQPKEEDERAAGYRKGFQEGYSYALQLKVGLN